MYDVLIVGAGITGAALAYELSQYKLSAAVLEKEDDVAKGTTRANSAIIHAGYDPEPGTLMARSNVKGSLLWKELAAKLGIEYKITGSLVLAYSAKEAEIVEDLYDRGIKNGVGGLRILSGAEAEKLEPNINGGVVSALLAETAAVINPWQACIALSEFAAKNSVEFFFSSEVSGVKRQDGVYTVEAYGREFAARYVVNAAGLNAESVHALAGGGGFGSRAVRGEYYILDKNQGDFVSRVIFRVPDASGKGVVIAPTVHGNLLVGATAEPNADAFDVASTARGLAAVRNEAAKLCGHIAFGENIRNFSGNRAYIDSGDFLVAESLSAPGFINMAGVKSPGLSGAPALAKEVVAILGSLGLSFERKSSLVEYKLPKRFAELSDEEKRDMISRDPRCGKVVCRCETVTEGEIIAALRGSLAPPTVSAVKRRVNAGMGRCQGGFCSVRVHEIIARERDIDYNQVTLDGGGSYIVTGDTKGGSSV